MACMEHYCSRCKWTAFDNNARHPVYCPECGAKVSHIFDEDVNSFYEESACDESEEEE